MSTSWRVTPRTELRLVIGFFLVPPVTGLVMLVTCLALWGVGAWVFEGTPSMDAAAGLGLGTGIIAVVVTVFGAVPAVAWLIRRGSVSFRTLLIVACALGNAPFAIIVAAILVTQLARDTLSSDVAELWFGWRGAIRAIALGLWLGSASVLLLWSIAFRGTELERHDE